MSVGAEGRRDPERVPGTVGVPETAGRPDSVLSLDGGEGMRHSDRRRAVLEHQGVGVVEPTERTLDLALPGSELDGDLLESRRPPQLDEASVDVAPDAEVKIVHGPLRIIRQGWGQAGVSLPATRAPSLRAPGSTPRR